MFCPDAIGFEDREKGYKHKARNLERFLFLKYVVAGQCMAWKNILDMKRAVDFVVSRPEVKADSIGCYGHSMGSTHTWLGSLDKLLSHLWMAQTHRVWVTQSQEVLSDTLLRQ